MRGFPKHFSTKQDYLNVLEDYPVQTKSALASLYADRFCWKRVRECAEGEVIPDSMDCIVQMEDVPDSEEKIRVLYERVEDENARYIRLGFTKDEILELIS